MDQRQKTEDGVTAHTQNSNAEKECCPQANNFRAIVLPAKLALGIDIIMEGGRRRDTWPLFKLGVLVLFRVFFNTKETHACKTLG